MTRYRPRKPDKKDLPTVPLLKDVTVVIPTLGRSILEKSLRYIVEGSARPGGIIVVDQSSSPEVERWIQAIRAFGVDARHLPSSQRGRAAGVNRGLEAVQTRFVAVTDDDCFVDTDWLSNMWPHLHSRPNSIVTGRIEAAGENVISVVTSSTPATYDRPRLTFDVMSGGNMGTSMNVVRHVGPFDEDGRLRTAEDGEWAYRALRKGIPIVYAPDVMVRHADWRDETERRLQYRDYARSHGGFYGKYLRRGDWFIALRVIIHHVRALKRWLRGIRTGDRELAMNGRAYVTGLLPGILSGMRRQDV